MNAVKSGGMSCALRNLQRCSPPRNANLESKRKFPPYFKRSAEMGGENAPSHLRQGTVVRSKLIGSQWQARFGGERFLSTPSLI
jgi:hypothetical protein